MGEGAQVFVCAGEASGDLYAAQVVGALRSMRPGLSFWGAGGRALEKEGVVLRHHIDDLAVTGFSELRNVAGAVAHLLFDSRKGLRRSRPALALLVDYPGANLRLAAMARAAGVPVLFYVAPQRWAWLSWRLAGLRRDVDRLAVTLPFEESFFASRGVDTTFVGHPLLDLQRIGGMASQRGGASSYERPVVTLWPGSRRNELDAHLPALSGVAQRLRREFQLLWVTAQPWAEQRCRRAFAGARCVSPELALAAGDLGLCSSGSATLQLALAGMPMAVFYRVGLLSALLARALLRVPYVALPNLIAGREVVPELLQQDMTIDALEDAVRLLVRPEVAAQQRASLAAVAASLGGPGVGERVAKLALGLLDGEQRSNQR